MKGYVRKGAPHAVCMAIREDVWSEIGYFMPVPKLLGYEDTLFFQRANEAGLKMGLTSRSWLHHFGQITQKAIHLEKKLKASEGLGNRNLMRLYLGQSWLARKINRSKRKRAQLKSVKNELLLFGITVHVLRQVDSFKYI
jgi:GT2 family glycosyltransferase